MSHGSPANAGLDVPLSMHFEPGRFGRLFPNLPPLAVADDKLKALGRAMIEPAGKENSVELDNPGVPAGFNYLGHFIDHDITFDTTPMPEVAIDPQQVHNFRTPKLDLDSLYGLGPDVQPYLYERPASGAPRHRFLLGETQASDDAAGKPIDPGKNDLPRSIERFATISDPRNDENLLVAQTHRAMLKFHNKVVDGGVADFAAARRIVTWHYQWIVLHDFLGRLIDPAALKDVLENGRRFYRFDVEPFIPVEFSVAAYRFGHTMVRHEYDHNRVFGPGSPGAGRLAPADLPILFLFTGFSSNGGRMPLPSNWPIDWRRFYDLPRPATVRLNASRKLDALLGKDLHTLPGITDPDLRSLSVRNLLRGVRAGLPSGQAVAAFMQLPSLTPDEIASGPDGAAAKAAGLERQTPLWFYILKEAEVHGGGRRLGAVGSRILAEVFVGLLQGDPNSFLVQAPTWKPELPSATPGDFTMADLLTFVGDINPVGDA